MAGKHADSPNYHRGRERLRVPLSSNWAIEYLRQLQLGSNPHIDHRARITVETRLKPVAKPFRSAVLRRLSKRETRIGLAILIAGFCGLAAMSFSNLSAERPVVQKSISPRIVCSLDSEVSVANPKNQLNFGGLESFVLDSSCKKAKYRVIRDVRTKQLVRSIKLETN